MTKNKAQVKLSWMLGFIFQNQFSRMDNYMLPYPEVFRVILHVLAKPNKDVDPTRKRTKNIVFRDILKTSK